MRGSAVDSALIDVLSFIRYSLIAGSLKEITQDHTINIASHREIKTAPAIASPSLSGDYGKS